MAGVEVSLNEQELLQDLSVSIISSAKKEDPAQQPMSPELGSAAKESEKEAQPEEEKVEKDGGAAIDLSEAVPLVLDEDKQMLEEEQKQDPKVKASEILQSVFGDGAEDAVSMEGGMSEGESVEELNEELAKSVVEEAHYIHNEDDDA